MSEIYNTWKGISTELLISKEPMIGMVYKVENKVGVLMSTNKEIVQLRDRKGVIHNVSKCSLELVIAT